MCLANKNTKRVHVMNWNIFLNRKAQHKAENRLLKFFIIVIGAVTLINTVVMMKALNYQKVVILPPNLETKTVISGDSLDEIYVSTFARYISSLAFSYTPATARKQFDELLILYGPEGFPAGKTTFYNLADKVWQTQVTQMYYIARIKVNTQKKRIELEGTRRQYIDDRKVEDGNKNYFIEYAVDNGKFRVVSITEAEPAVERPNPLDKKAGPDAKK